MRCRNASGAGIRSRSLIASSDSGVSSGIAIATTCASGLTAFTNPADRSSGAGSNTGCVQTLVAPARSLPARIRSARSSSWYWSSAAPIAISGPCSRTSPIASRTRIPGESATWSPRRQSTWPMPPSRARTISPTTSAAVRPPVARCQIGSSPSPRSASAASRLDCRSGRWMTFTVSVQASSSRARRRSTAGFDVRGGVISSETGKAPRVIASRKDIAPACPEAPYGPSRVNSVPASRSRRALPTVPPPPRTATP